MCISCDKTFLLETTIFYLVTLTLTFDLLLKKLNLDNDRALILHISIPSDKSFLLIAIHLYFLPSGLDLDFDLLLEKLKLVSAGGISPVRTDPDLVLKCYLATQFVHDFDEVLCSLQEGSSV